MLAIACSLSLYRWIKKYNYTLPDWVNKESMELYKGNGSFKQTLVSVEHLTKHPIKPRFAPPGRDVWSPKTMITV